MNSLKDFLKKNKTILLLSKINKTYSKKFKEEKKYLNTDITKKLKKIDQKIALIKINQVQY